MYPEDRVIVGVINRKRDLTTLLEERWYRIPRERWSRDGVYAEYLAFYLSGSAARDRDNGIHYFAEVRGVELAHRRDLLPKEANHKRADEVYYKLALSPPQRKTPPILNPTRRPISFVFTTWDRFVNAQTVRDLYSKSDYYVDRIYHALREEGFRPLRTWEAECRRLAAETEPNTPAAPGLRILCENGTVTAMTDRHSGAFFLDESQDDDAILSAIRAEIARQGGPVTVNIPLE